MIGCWLHIENFDMVICDACLVIIVHWRCSHVDYIDWFSYILLHSDSSCCMIILLSLTCIFSFFYISFILVWLILYIVYYLVYLNILFILVIYLSWLSYSCLACVYIWVMYLLFAWLLGSWLLFFRVSAWVACLCGTDIYPLTSNSLVSVKLVSLDLVFDMRLVTLFALQPS